jgi:hypothetical protein
VSAREGWLVDERVPSSFHPPIFLCFPPGAEASVTHWLRTELSASVTIDSVPFPCLTGLFSFGNEGPSAEMPPVPSFFVMSPASTA